MESLRDMDGKRLPQNKEFSSSLMYYRDKYNAVYILKSTYKPGFIGTMHSKTFKSFLQLHDPKDVQQIQPLLIRADIDYFVEGKISLVKVPSPIPYVYLGCVVFTEKLLVRPQVLVSVQTGTKFKQYGLMCMTTSVIQELDSKITLHVLCDETTPNVDGGTILHHNNHLVLCPAKDLLCNHPTYVPN